MNDPFKKYRRQFRIWKNDRRLKREQDYYSSKFASAKLTIPDDKAIRQAMRYRFPTTRPKEKGTLNIIAIYHHYNWENESLRPSLEKFGQVRHYDWFENFNHQKKDPYISERDLNKCLKIESFEEGYKRIRENCALYAGIEAVGVSDLYSKYSCARKGNKSNIVVLDVEISFKSLEKKEQSQPLPNK